MTVARARTLAADAAYEVWFHFCLFDFDYVKHSLLYAIQYCFCSFLSTFLVVSLIEVLCSLALLNRSCFSLMCTGNLLMSFCQGCWMLSLISNLHNKFCVCSHHKLAADSYRNSFAFAPGLSLR